MSDSASAARQLSHLCRLHARPDASRCLTVREGQPCASYSPDCLDRVDVAGRPAVRSVEPLGLDVGRHSFGWTFGPASTGGSWAPVGRVAEPLGLDVGRHSFGWTFGPASTGGSWVPVGRVAEPLGLDVGRHSSGRTFGPASTGGSWVPVGRVAEPLGLDVGRHSSGRTFGPASTGGSWAPVGRVAEPLGLDVGRHSFGRTFGPASTGGSWVPVGRDLALRYERPAPAVARRDEPLPEPSSWLQAPPAPGQPPSYGIFGFAVAPPRGEAERRGLARR